MADRVDIQVRLRGVRAASGAPGAGVARANRSDKQLAVEAELLRAPGDSDRAIGRRVGVDHKTVGAARQRLAVAHG